MAVNIVDGGIDGGIGGGTTPSTYHGVEYWATHGVTEDQIFDAQGQLRPGWQRTANGYARTGTGTTPDDGVTPPPPTTTTGTGTTTVTPPPTTTTTTTPPPPQDARAAALARFMTDMATRGKPVGPDELTDFQRHFDNTDDPSETWEDKYRLLMDYNDLRGSTGQTFSGPDRNTPEGWAEWQRMRASTPRGEDGRLQFGELRPRTTSGGGSGGSGSGSADWWDQNALPGGAGGAGGAGDAFGAQPAPFGEVYTSPARPSYLAGEYTPPELPIDLRTAFRAPTMGEVEASPGYDTRMRAGQRTIERSAAAKGSILSGGTQQALARYGQEFGANEYGNEFSRRLTGRQQAQGEYQDTANLSLNSRGVNENAFQTDTANSLNAFNARARTWLDNVTTRRNWENDIWGRNQDMVGNALTASGLRRPS